MEPIYDVAVIGGGPAGLSAALVLGRSRRSVAVIDEGRPRNRVTRGSHGFLTRDGISPAEFRAIAVEQMKAYPSVRFWQDRAAAVEGTDGRFRIATAQGRSFRSKKLLFATGMQDLPLEIAGLKDVYGRSAFVCPYCDGWELRDKPLAVIARGAQAYHFARVLAGWTNRYAICTNGPDEWTREQRSELIRRRIPVFGSPIRRIRSADGQVRGIELLDGSIVSCEGIFFTPRLTAGSDLPYRLGCRVAETGKVLVDELGRTGVPGVYSAGDAASERHQVVMAAASGSMAAVGINNELLDEAWRAGPVPG